MSSVIAMLTEAIMTMITVWVEKAKLCLSALHTCILQVQRNYHFKIYITLKLTQSITLFNSLIQAHRC